MKTFKQFIKEENEEESPLYVIHGGRDFDKIDKKYFGSGEPGNIRPLGKGLYGYVLDPNNEEEFHGAVRWSKRYADKYGGENKKLHVFEIPRNTKTIWHGPRHIDLPTGHSAEEKAYYSALRHADTFEPGPERKQAYANAHLLQAAAEQNPGKPQMRAQRLPIDQTEVAIHDLDIPRRVGKFDASMDSNDILNSLRKKV